MEAQEDERAMFLDYIVAFFDLMGQKEKLNQLRKAPTNEDEEKRFMVAANQTYRAVKYIRKGLRIGFENFKKASLSETNDDPNSELRKMVECNYQFHFYSDSFAVTCRYSNDENRPLIQHVFALLSSLSFMMIICLRNGSPVRGGVEIGKAFEWPEGNNLGIYGPVMLDVDELEHIIAWYPRIVIGSKLYETINSWNKKLDEGNRYYSSYREIITFCKRMIWTDKDGLPTLDYLGSEIYGLSKPVPQMETNVKLGWEFITREYERFKNNKDSQMAMKYTLLKDYYSTRLSIWNNE